MKAHTVSKAKTEKSQIKRSAFEKILIKKVNETLISELTVDLTHLFSF